MEIHTDIVAAAIGLLAAAIAYVGIRDARRSNKLAAAMQSASLDIQKQEWQREFGEKLQELTYLVTQQELLTYRVEQRNHDINQWLATLPTTGAVHPAVLGIRKVLKENLELSAREQEEFQKTRDFLSGMWGLKSVSPEVLQRLQQWCTSSSDTTARLRQALDQIEHGLEAAKTGH